MAKLLLFDPLGRTHPQCLYILRLAGMLLPPVPNPAAFSLPLPKTPGCSVPSAAPVKHIRLEPVVLSPVITTLCNCLLLPMHLFPFIHFSSRLFPWLQQTREGYKDDLTPESQG